MNEPETTVDEIRIRVEDLTGARHLEASVAPDAPVATAYGPVAARFEYELEEGAGRVFGLALYHRRRAAVLAPEATFAAADVKAGDTLVVLPIAAEGGRS